MNYRLFGEVKVRVRYAETDRMDYVYNGVYATYYEVARTEVLRNTGFSYKKLEDDGYLLPLARLTSDFIKPAFYDDLLTIKVYLRYTKIKVEFIYEIFNQEQQLVNKGYTLLVFTNAKTRKPTFAPKYFLDLLEEHLSGAPEKKM